MATKAEQLSNSNLMVILVLVSLLVVGASALIVKTLVGSITLDTHVLSAKNKANNQLTSDVNAAPQLVDAYQALGSQSQVLADALPTTVDFPSLMVTIDNMSNAAGIQLSSVSPATVGAIAASSAAAATPASVGTPTPQPYEFSIEFTGTYDALIKMLGEIETSARPMRVQGLQLNGAGSSLQGSIDLDTYYQAAGTLPFSEEAIK